MGRLRDRLRILGLFIGLSVLLYQMYDGINTVSGMDILLQPKLLIASVGLSTWAIFCQIFAWLIIMRGIGVNITLKDAIKGYVLNFLPRYIPGTVWGYLSRATWLNKSFGVEYQLTHWGSIIEVVIGIESCMVMLSVYLFSLLPLRLWWTPASILLFVLLGSWFILKKISRIPFMGVFKNPFYGLTISMKGWLMATTALWSNWLIYGMITILYLNFYGSYPLGMRSILETSTIFSLSWLGGFMVWIFPAGLGPRDLLLSKGISTIFSVTQAQANLMAVIIRLTMMFSELVWAIGGMITGGLRITE
ncbi:hypothetical protein SE15_06910 [Thermanaerothrix daxensis]|uniref:Lysylphosphatidylglycerol synthetase n=2 Tax=Thermanaerothrix daxensis TaxID=869279 RepID=A0A0P6YEK0_9CHLR|nr:hypothetical protein SE15_06910 [Thermanaerothrix daxensis]